MSQFLELESVDLNHSSHIVDCAKRTLNRTYSRVQIINLDAIYGDTRILALTLDSEDKLVSRYFASKLSTSREIQAL